MTGVFVTCVHEYQRLEKTLVTIKWFLWLKCYFDVNSENVTGWSENECDAGCLFE